MHFTTKQTCQFCHVISKGIPKERTVSKLNLFRCLECNKDYVPEIIMASVDPPEGLHIIGPSKYIEARIVKLKKKNLKGE